MSRSMVIMVTCIQTCFGKTAWLIRLYAAPCLKTLSQLCREQSGLVIPTLATLLQTCPSQHWVRGMEVASQGLIREAPYRQEISTMEMEKTSGKRMRSKARFHTACLTLWLRKWDRNDSYLHRV